jgi:hypothetical protein
MTRQWRKHFQQRQLGNTLPTNEMQTTRMNEVNKRPVFQDIPGYFRLFQDNF